MHQVRIRFGEHGVEVVDELEEPLPQIIKRRKAGALEQTSDEDAEPTLHLVQPGAVFWCEDESDAVAGVREKVIGAALQKS